MAVFSISKIYKHTKLQINSYDTCTVLWIISYPHKSSKYWCKDNDPCRRDTMRMK